jgi:hypothetical protein
MLCLVTVLALQSGAQTPAAPPANPSLIRVWVDPDSDDIKELAASVKDLAESVASKKKSLVTVADEDLADVTVHVVQRLVEVPKLVFGVGSRPGEPPGGVTTLKTAKLQVQLRFGDMQVSLANKNKAYDNPRGWKSAADDLADQIDKWVGQYRAEIIKSRR